ncbi:unnamed protein product [Durusdinium trenchii]|uniref:Uncharacterized protein n=1 Tax=Durusdinium trenchii TaxID=1381693 RepID=A0ABP0HH22_9DINO
MLSGYDGKRQAYDTAGLVGVRFEDIAGGFLEFELLSQFRNRPLLSVVNSCMGSDRENDGSSAWRTGHCVAGKLTSSFGIPRVAQHLLIGFAGNFEDGLNWVLFRLQNHSAHSEFTYAFGTQNKTNPGFAGRVYIYGVQHAVESAGMWKSVTRPCAIDSEGCITSHNFPRQDTFETGSFSLIKFQIDPLIALKFQLASLALGGFMALRTASKRFKRMNAGNGKSVLNLNATFSYLLRQ